MGFLAGFASGAFQAANNEFAQQDNTVATQMKQRGALTDQLADQYQKNQDKINATKTLQTSIMTNYNVDPDTAYTAATNPAFEKMHPMDQQDYIKSLKPVQGKMTPATGGPQAPVLPATQVPGVRLGPFTLPGKTLPAVSAPPTPVDPGHQMFESVGFDPEKRAKALAAVSDVKNWQAPNDDGTTSTDVDLHKQAMDAYDKRDYNTALTLQSQVKGKAGGAGSADKAFAQAAGLIGNGTVNVEDRDAVAAAYSGLGGKDPQAVDRLMTMYHKSGSGNTTDPVREQKIQDEIKLHGADRAAATDTVDKINTPMIGADGQRWIYNQRDHTMKPAEGGPEHDKKEIETAKIGIQNANINYKILDRTMKVLDGNPSAAGLPGEFGEKVGGALTELANTIGGKEAGDWVDKQTNASNSQPFRSNVRLLGLEIGKQLVAGSGARLSEKTIDMVHDIIGGLDYHHSVQMTMSSMQNLQKAMVEASVMHLKTMDPPASDFYTSKSGIDSRIDHLIKTQYMTTKLAHEIVQGEANSLRGKDILSGPLAPTEYGTAQNADGK